MKARFPATRRWWISLALFSFASATLVLFWFDPAQHSFYPRCLLHEFTGLNCPGCGALRALHHLSHGELRTALHFNPLVVLAGPFLLWWLARKFWNTDAGPSLPNLFARPVVGWALVTLVIVFSIVRNLPFAPFTAFAP
ncbi:MAG: DUF2752 domain-containing protein [Verrucomicrobia bacterium]|nr:DUF2752 domain-containing protein [Verrucomicrobiota bacterium]